jgi:hypothetical protein
MLSLDERVCRACTRECGPNDLNNFLIKSLIYSEITSIEVNFVKKNSSKSILNVPFDQVTADDGLPRHLCQICCQTLDEFKTFKELCHKSIQNLRNSIVFKVEGTFFLG